MIQILILVCIGGIIGWITNKVAIYLLFHPYTPRKFLFITYQGLIPKRKEEIATKVAQIVSQELIQSPLSKLPEQKEKISAVIVSNLNTYVETFIRKYPVAAIACAIINPETLNTYKVNIKKELGLKIDDLIYSIATDMDIEGEVYSKISSYSIAELERLVKSIAQKEFKSIELLGGVLGMLIGLIQALLLLLAV